MQITSYFTEIKNIKGHEKFSNLKTMNYVLVKEYRIFSILFLKTITQQVTIDLY